MTFFLSDFQIHRPKYESLQEKTLEWLISAHTQAERMRDPSLSDEDLASFRKELKKKLLYVGCKPDQVSKRGHDIEDFLHSDWEKMEIYRLSDRPYGTGLEVRSKVFEEIADRVFEKFYPKEALSPDDLIHTSCTGYVSPSGAQKIVSKREWKNCTVTHAYHMGCYASIPSIRIGKGFLSANPTKSRADVVHTEICSLHTNPSLHSADQLVAQSLFADGFIKYSIQRNSTQPSMRILSEHEEIVPKSLSAMTWNVSDWGFELYLAKEIPVLLARAIKKYLEALCAKAGKTCDEVLKKALFAIHPGGPKILQQIQDIFSLSNEQLRYSRKILHSYGNMSSATLPHIWETVCSDPDILTNTPIVSMAFGPGLSICGIFLEKEL